VRRCSGFHIGTPLENQVPHKESQPTPPTQQLSGSALRDQYCIGRAEKLMGYAPGLHCNFDRFNFARADQASSS
jgi:hypothetical protein